MREREAQLSLLLDTAMDAILVLDGEFRITRLNPRPTELFACTEEDLAGENFLDFLSPAAAARFSRLQGTSGPPRRASAMVAGRFGAIRWDKTPFPPKQRFRATSIMARRPTPCFFVA